MAAIGPFPVHVTQSLNTGDHQHLEVASEKSDMAGPVLVCQATRIKYMYALFFFAAFLAVVDVRYQHTGIFIFKSRTP